MDALYKVGETVWFEEVQVYDEDGVSISESEIIESMPDKKLYKLQCDKLWYSHYELFKSKKDLVSYLIENNSSDMSELLEDIEALLAEMEDLKKKCKIIEMRKSKLKEML